MRDIYAVNGIRNRPAFSLHFGGGCPSSYLFECTSISVSVPLLSLLCAVKRMVRRCDNPVVVSFEFDRVTLLAPYSRYRLPVPLVGKNDVSAP